MCVCNCVRKKNRQASLCTCRIESLCVCRPLHFIQLQYVKEHSHKLHAVSHHHHHYNISLSHLGFLALAHEIFDIQVEISLSYVLELLHLQAIDKAKQFYFRYIQLLMHHGKGGLKEKECQLNSTTALSACLADSHVGRGLISCSLCSFLSSYSL